MRNNSNMRSAASAALTPAQLHELDFTPGGECLLSEDKCPSAANLAGCVVYIQTRNGRGFWYYVAGSGGGMLYGMRRAGSRWVRKDLPLSSVARYY